MNALVEQIIGVTFGVLLVVYLVVLPYVCWQKGKQVATVIGIFVPILWLPCAITRAKPGSPWADRHDEGERLGDACEQFPKEAVVAYSLDANA